MKSGQLGPEGLSRTELTRGDPSAQESGRRGGLGQMLGAKVEPHDRTDSVRLRMRAVRRVAPAALRSVSVGPFPVQIVRDRTTRTGTDLYDGVPLSLST